MSNPLSPKSYIKDPLQPPNLFYRGSSMRGTFKSGDKLIIEKTPFEQINKGDLIIFSKNNGKEDDFIVHRVAAISPKGLVTRGDNCITNDKDFVIEENIIGRVVKYDRRSKIRQVRNRHVGALRATLLHGRMQALRLFKCLLKNPYHKLMKTGIVAKIWQPEIELIRFMTSFGPLVKYVHKGRTVGICWKDKNHCWQKRPYDLILILK